MHLYLMALTPISRLLLDLTSNLKSAKVRHGFHTHFSFGNKLQQKHLLWEKHKMNVKLAAQTLSASVANAIDFLHDGVQLPEFQESKATSEFIRRIDLAFDLMNSHNHLAKGSKQTYHTKVFP